MKYQDLMDELKSLQGLLTLKNQSLAEEELSLKWFTIQEEISAKKRKELSEGNEHLFLRKVPIQDLYNIFRNTICIGLEKSWSGLLKRWITLSTG